MDNGRVKTLFVSVVLFSARAAFSTELVCEQLPGFFETMHSQHLVHPDVAKLALPAAAKYVELLDPAKSELLQMEADQIKADVTQAMPKIANGDCSTLSAALDLIAERCKQDLAFAQKMLGEGYKLDDSVALTIDPEKRGFAKSDAERSALLAKLVHFQIASNLNSGQTLEAAKKQLIHHYELIVKRVNERKEKGKAVSLFADAYAEAIDPHSSYMAGDEFANFQIAMHLSLEGIGAQLASRDGFTVVESLVPGGMAEKNGKIRAKDKIIAVAQKNQPPVSTIDMDLDDVVKMIRGPKGTVVTLTVLRESPSSHTFSVSITRDKIDVSSQAAKLTFQERKVNGKTEHIGVIDLPSFYGGERGGRSASHDIATLVTQAKQKGVDAIVLDLTRNGGGLLEEAVDISGLFLRQGGVVGTKDASGKMEVLADQDQATLYAGPLVVLESEISASASEILAGALHDYHRAVIVGSEHTFGKGTIQQLLPLPQQLGAIKVTVGMFFLPGGVSTQQKGVAADVIVPTLYDSVEQTEAKLEHSLPPQRIDAFLSNAANGTGEDHWRPLAAEDASTLASRSHARVATEPGFSALKKKLAELKSADQVKISELRKKAKAGGGKDDEDADADSFKKFDATSLSEAVNIAADAAAIAQHNLSGDTAAQVQ